MAEADHRTGDGWTADLWRFEDGSKRWKLQFGDEVRWLPEMALDQMLDHLRQGGDIRA